MDTALKQPFLTWATLAHFFVSTVLLKWMPAIIIFAAKIVWKLAYVVLVICLIQLIISALSVGD